MMKSYTDLEQSKALAEILPLESADMEYMFLKRDVSKVSNVPFVKNDDEPQWPDDSSYNFIPCWSLVALLGVLGHSRCFQGDKPTYWFCGCFGKDKLYHEVEADNPVDACVEMIIHLHEQKLL